MLPIEEFFLNVLDGIVEKAEQYVTLEPRNIDVVERRTSYALPITDTFTPDDKNLIDTAVTEITNELAYESRYAGKKLRLVGIKMGGIIVNPITKEPTCSIHLEFNK